MTPSLRVRVGVGLALAFVVIAVDLALSRGTPTVVARELRAVGSPKTPADNPLATPRERRDGARAHAPAVETQGGLTAEILRDTDVDGALRVDARGAFVADEGALRLFNYFFSAEGQTSRAVLIARIEQEIAGRLPLSARAGARALLDEYLAYRDAGKELATQLRDASPEERVEALYALRRKVFGEGVAERMFAREEERRAAAIERFHILTDERLSDAERTAQLEALERDLPAFERERRAAQLSVVATALVERELHARGASPDELFQARVDTLGRDAATRLARIDEEERDFAQALRALRAWRAEQSNPSDAQLDELIAARFSPEQRRRARVQMDAGFPLLATP
jgi:lipase chaperone LimK